MNKRRRFMVSLMVGLAVFATSLAGAEFRALVWEGSLTEVTYAGQSGGEKLEISSSALGKWRKITPSADGVEFKRVTTPAASAGQPAAAPVTTVLARVVWPAGVARALLLFVPAPAGAATPYAVVVIPERDAAASPAALRLFNYSANAIAVRIGDEPPTQLASFAFLESDVRPASGSQALKLAYSEDAQWKIATQTMIAMPPGFSVYVFIRNVPRFELEPNNPTVGYKMIYDRLAPPAVAAQE